jgi:hypothetical protein
MQPHNDKPAATRPPVSCAPPLRAPEAGRDPGAGLVTGLTAEAVDAFDAKLGSSMTMPRSPVQAYRCRLASLRQILFETG